MSDDAKFDATVQHGGKMSRVELCAGYWSGLLDIMWKKGGRVASPSRMSGMFFAETKGMFNIQAMVVPHKDQIAVRLVIRGKPETREKRRAWLEQNKKEIEKDLRANKAIGEKLEWTKNGIGLIRENCGAAKSDKNWSELHQWMHKRLEDFYAIFHEEFEEFKKSNRDDRTPS